MRGDMAVGSLAMLLSALVLVCVALEWVWP